MVRYVLLASLTLSLVSTPANAWIYVGDPILGIWVDRDEGDITDGLAYVRRIRVWNCDQTYQDYPVWSWEDLDEGFIVYVDEGDLCGVSVDWIGTLTLASGTSWQLAYVEDYTSVPIAAPGAYGSAPLTPFSVTAGEFSGSDPELRVQVF